MVSVGRVAAQGAGAPGMTLTGRLIALVAGVLAPALLAVVVLSGLALRDGLREQLRLRNQEAAVALAAAWSNPVVDVGAVAARAQMAFDAGAHRSLRVLGSDGTVRFERQRDVAPSGVPAWFAGALGLEPEPGRAPFGGTGDGGTVEVQGSADAAWQALWRAGERALALTAALAALALVLTAWLARGLRRSLKTTVAQARAIEQARFVTAEEPGLDELREVTRALNAMVRRLREMFDRQVEQVARLQRQAQTDAVSGLPLRAPFTSLLGERLADPTGVPSVLLLVRLANLERLNERHGRETADRLLQSLADVLLTYVERVPGSCAGRLNGTDFALFLPAAGIAHETAESLRGALDAAPGARQAGAEFVLGGCDGLRGLGAGAALAAADAALAVAEQEEGIAVASPPDVAGGGGARAWREQIADALAQGRVRLAEFPVVDASGRLIHLECPLRVQLEPGGEFQVARRWLALAARSRLLPEVDLAALDLALAAIAADGRPRCVHVALRSFGDPEFGAAVQARLDARADAAARLSIEWEPSARHGAAAALRAAATGWRQRGVTLGVEHAGAAPKALAGLKELRVSYVKVDAQHLRALADDEAVRDYAAGLATLIRGLGMRAIAEGVDQPRDLAALWALGFDGATGSAVKLAAH